MSAQGQIEDTPDPADEKIARYVNEITLYERETRSWNTRRKRIIKRYKDERDNARESAVSRFNILWSMVQTLMPALYARDPKPDIARRFKDDDPVGRVASDVLERSVTYFTQTQDFAYTMKQCVKDYLLPGRAVAWVRYIPHTRTVEGEQVTDDEADEPDTVEEVYYEEAKIDFVNTEDFGHNICRTWEEVSIVWRKVYLTRAELKKRFPKAKDIPLDYKLKNSDDKPLDDGTGKATIYELWDEKRKKAYWFHRDVPDALDVRDDPLGLENFFPCPRPLFCNLANDSLIPVPDFVQYQDQAVELDSLTSRISSITKSLKVAGVYDASAQGISRLLAEGVENQLISVESWAVFAEKGGIKGAMDFLPLDMIASALKTLYEVRDQVKQDLYEITGIADIVRGQSDPNETMGAQQIKSNFATMRLSDRQADVQRFVRDMIRLMVNVIANHFSIETIKLISGVRLLTQQEKVMYAGAAQSSPLGGQPSQTPPASPQQPGMGAAQPQPQQPPMPALPPDTTPDQLADMMEAPSWEDVEKLIRDQPLRCFRIDIETDSIIKADEEADKASRVEFLKAAGQFLTQAVEAGSQQPEMVPLLAQMLMFAVRAFPVGKELEGAFQSAIQKLEKSAANPQPKPDPEMIKIQGQMQLEQGKAQADIQIQQARVQADAQLAQQKMQNEMQLEQARMHAKQQAEAAEAQSQMMADQRENELENAREMAKIHAEQAMAQFKAELEGRMKEELAHIDAATKVEVARITAGKSDGTLFETRESAYEARGSTVAKVEEMQGQMAQMSQAMNALLQHAHEQANKPSPPQPIIPDHTQHLAALTNAITSLAQSHKAGQDQTQKNHGKLLQAVTAEKELVRDPKTGRAAGVRVKNAAQLH